MKRLSVILAFLILLEICVNIEGFNILTSHGAEILTPAGSKSSNNPDGSSSESGSNTGSSNPGSAGSGSNPAFFGYDINLSKDKPPM